MLARHLGGASMGGKPDFSMRVGIEELELVFRESKSPTEFLGDLQYAQTCTILWTMIVSFPLCQAVWHNVTFSIAIAHAIPQDIKDKGRRNQ